MRTYGEKLITKDIVEKIECNKCGKETDVTDKENVLAHNREKGGFHEFKVEFNYSSPVEGQRWTFDLCDECLVDFVETFKVEPEILGKEGFDYEYPVTPIELLEEPPIREDE